MLVILFMPAVIHYIGHFDESSPGAVDIQIPTSVNQQRSEVKNDFSEAKNSESNIIGKTDC